VLLARVGTGLRSETVRRTNLSVIIRELHFGGPQSRSALVGRTELTRSAIRSLISELVSADLVAEVRAAPVGVPGRPSTMVCPNAEGAVVLALDITVDSLAAALIGLGGTILASARVDRPPTHLEPSEIVADLVSLAEPILREPAAAGRFIGIGVAVVGVVRRSDGLVSMAPNLGWREIPLGRLVAAAFDGDAPVAVANEADLGALAELRRGAAVGADDVLFVSGEVGVGGGVVVDGRPMIGAAGYGGEIGHMPVNPDGLPCRCGSIGCWETEVGEGALLRHAGRRPDGGREAVDAVLADAAAGLPRAVAALDEVGRWLGVGLAGLVNVFDPELIVLGGFFGRILPRVGELVDRELDRRALAAPRSLVCVVPAKLGVDAPMIGAGELAMEPLLADPARWLLPRRPRLELAGA